MNLPLEVLLTLPQTFLFSSRANMKNSMMATSLQRFTLRMVELVKSRSHKSGSMNKTLVKNGIIKVQKGPKGRKERECVLRQ